MKKILLLISFVILSLVTYALNPFAYALSSTLSDDQKTLTVNYTLNADATSVTITVFCDGEQYYAHTYTGNAKNYDDARIHTLEVPMTDFPGGLCTWEITVTGNSVSVPTQESTFHYLYCPYGLAIDKNPESECFGRILVAEAKHNITPTNTTRDYISKSNGKVLAGIYTFQPDFTTDRIRHFGGNDFTRQIASVSGGGA